MTHKDILKKIKFIVFDLDGTLLNDEGNIGEESKRLIRDLKKLDVRFSFATGRLHNAITRFVEELEIVCPIISLDGCLIKNQKQDKVIFESSIKEKYVKKAVHLADDLIVNIALCHADAIYYTENNSGILRLMNKASAQYQQVDSYDNFFGSTLEIVFAGDQKDSMKYIYDRLSFPYSLGLNASFYRSKSKENIFYVEVRKAGISKGKSFLRLMKHYKVKPEEAVVIGDWYNDLSLFETGAYKVAVANAIPELKNKADYVTSSTNHQDGVAEFLHLLLKVKLSNK
ncbi:MAG TPA: HAD family hydrolase [Ignavibacteriaceae bacterium]|nr:HAD family hydrolase [Ignavibacteriaceae bacterium]